MARGLVERGRRLLRSLLWETALFAVGVEMAEARPEAAISLARTCLGLVNEAMRQLPGLEGRDVSLERAYGELEIARDLFESILVGKPVSFTARKSIPKELREEGF